MIDAFSELLQDFGRAINLTLSSENNISTLLVDEKLFVQLKFHQDEEDLLIISPLTQIPPGKFRENALAKALQANQMEPNFGFFSYNSKSNELLLFNYLHLTELNGENLKKFLSKFIPVAFFWKNSLEKGDLQSIASFIENPSLIIIKLND